MAKTKPRSSRLSRAESNIGPLQAVGALADHHVALMDVDEVDPDTRSRRDDLRPRPATGVRGRSCHQPEVRGAVIGDDQEAVLLVIDRVLDVCAAPFDQLRW